MLGAIVSLLIVVAAAFAVTKIGGIITLLFIAALVFLAYRRLSLLAFTVTFTVLLAAYTVLGAPAGIWKGFRRMRGSGTRSSSAAMFRIWRQFSQPAASASRHCDTERASRAR